MKSLSMTTAMVLALGLPFAASAQTAEKATTEAGTTLPAAPGFLVQRGLGTILATDLMGHDVYARRVPAGRVKSETGTGMPGMTTFATADLANMDKVGQVGDLVLAMDGGVTAVVVGIGAFLGTAGMRDVAVTMDQLSFATLSDGNKGVIVVLNTGADMLRTSPVFDKTSRMTVPEGMAKTAAADAEAVTDRKAERAMLQAPAMTREGYQQVEAKDVSIDVLIGKAVYGTNDKDVGTVEDIIVGKTGTVEHVVVEFGGFLGMGSQRVSLGFDELTILTNGDKSDIRVYVDATKDQIRALPRYEPAK